jgi:hypothetical protein
MILLALALLLGSVAAFTRTEKLKLERSPIAAGRVDRWLSPVCDCPQRAARLTLRLRRAERLAIVVVNDERQVVRTLAEELVRGPGPIHLTWGGRDEVGHIVPDGAYRVRVRLEQVRRTILIPNEVHVDTRPPEVRLGAVPASTFSPDGDGVEDVIELRYTASEAGAPVLLVDGVEGARGRTRRGGASMFTWTGATPSGTVVPGTYQISLVIEDRAGNRSEPTDPVPIVVTSALTAP